MQSPLGDMDRVGKYFAIGVISVVGTLYALGGYARIWEYRQPKQSITQAEILSIGPYSSHNELHWSSKGNRVRTRGEDRVIDFPLKNWDKTVRVGDSVDLVVRRSFPLFGNELDGISINDYK